MRRGIPPEMGGFFASVAGASGPTRAPDFRCEPLEPSLLLSTTSGLDNELSSLISNSCQDNLYNSTVTIVDVNESTDFEQQLDGMRTAPALFSLTGDSSNGTLPSQAEEPRAQEIVSDEPLEQLATGLQDDVSMLPQQFVQSDSGAGDGDGEANLVVSQQDNTVITIVSRTQALPSDSESSSDGLSSYAAGFDYDNSAEQLVQTLLAANPSPTSSVTAASEIELSERLASGQLIASARYGED